MNWNAFDLSARDHLDRGWMAVRVDEAYRLAPDTAKARADSIDGLSHAVVREAESEPAVVRRIASSPSAEAHLSTVPD